MLSGYSMDISMPSLRDRQRRTILDAAARCLLEEGGRQVTVGKIAKSAQMSPGNIYRYFEGKEDILRTLALEGVSGWKPAAGEPDFDEILEATLGMALDGALSALGIELMAEARRNEDLAGVYKGNKLRFTTGLKRAIERAQREERIRPELDAEALAVLIVCATEGMANRAAFGEPVDKMTVARLIRQLVVPASQTSATPPPEAAS